MCSAFTTKMKLTPFLLVLLVTAAIWTYLRNRRARQVENPRAGWEEAFTEMAQQGDDQLLNEETSTAFDEQEWKW